MARVALVTGGTRGIGAAISIALQKAGRHVIANYAGNTAAAEAFSRKPGSRPCGSMPGITSNAWPRSDTIAAKHGTIEILVNNAGITRDTTISKMTPRDVGRGDRYQSRLLLQPFKALL